jgi:acylpyruvate hydrolase
MDSVGALIGDQIVHLTRAYASYLNSVGIPSPDPLAEAQLPSNMLAFLAAGERAIVAAQRAIEVVETQFSEGYVPRGMRGEPLLSPLAEVKLLAPVPRPGKLLCIGLNYRDHAEEVGMKVPERPVLFSKFPSCVVGPDEPIVMPTISKEVDYEGELAVVIGKVAKGVSEENALDHVAGYTLMNDVSARDLQLRLGGGQWVWGKSADTFAPLGPAIVTRDEVPDPHNLPISTRLNGEIMQHSNTRNLIFNVPQLVSFLSRAITLEPGDVIATGTPPGVGDSRKPPVYLKDGDRVVIEIEGVGVLANPVVAG